MPDHLKVEDNVEEKPAFEAKLQELSDRLEAAESQLQEIHQFNNGHHLLSESFERSHDGPNQTEHLSSSVLEIESLNADHESTNEIEDVVQRTDLGDIVEEKKIVHEEEHTGALEADVKVAL